MTETIVLKDTFTRSVTDGWSSADTGQLWEITEGAAADYDVNGALGIIALPTAAINHTVTFPGSYTDFKIRGTIRVSAIATGNSVVADFIVRNPTYDGNNMLVARVEFGTTNAISVLYKIVGGSVTNLGFLSKGLYSGGVDWHFIIELKGSTIRIKLWGSAGSEPTAWDVSATQTNFPGPGRIFIMTRREAGNTNSGLSVSYNVLEVVTVNLLATVEVLPQFLDDYEFKFGHDGLLLNGELSHATVGGPVWDIQRVTGLDLPDIKSSDKEFDGIDGGVLEANNISMRTVRLEGILYAHQDDDLEVYLDQLKANFSPVPRMSSTDAFDVNERPFFIKPPGVAERFVFAKPVGLSYEWDGDRRFNSTSFQVILQCQIPTFFSPELHKISGTMTGSLDTPTTLTVYNAGNYYGYAVVRLLDLVHTLPITIRLSHLESGKELEILLGTPLLAGRPLAINLRQHTVFIIDDPSENIRDQVTGEEWWRLAPGANTIQVSNDRDAGTVDVLWRDEWF